MTKETDSEQLESEEETLTTSSKRKKKRKKRSPGTLYELSQACRETARTVASTGLFVSVYDNINLMFRVAEQILGRKSEQKPRII